MHYVQLSKMNFAKVLLVMFSSLRLTLSSPPCADVTHSDCGDFHAHLLDVLPTPNQEACRLICAEVGKSCQFSLFDKEAFGLDNCRLYGGNFSKSILQCGEVAGPRDLQDGCDLMEPKDLTCQVYRSGKCDFAKAEETSTFQSWKNCHQFCLSHPKCQFWSFDTEGGLCQIMYSRETDCTWEFSPRYPILDECNARTTTIPSTTCDVPNSQEHGDWFCLSSSDPFHLTCHLECDPGYVPDTASVTKCDHGKWDSNPICVVAIALITGNSKIDSNTVEIYSEQLQLHKTLPNLPDDRSHHSLDYVNSMVLLCGGTDTPKSCLVLTPSNQWNPHSNTIMERYLHSSVSMLGELHLMGGHDSSIRTTEHLAPPLNQWHYSWNLLENTYRTCATKMGPEVLMISGGYYNDASSVVSYNVTSGVATRLQNLIHGRWNHGCAYVKKPGSAVKRVLVVGGLINGYNGNTKYVGLRSSEMYNMATGEWSSTGDLTNIRNAVRMVVLGDHILAMGGFDEINRVALSSVDRFNFTSMQWTATEKMLQARWYHAVTVVPPGAVEIDQD